MRSTRQIFSTRRPHPNVPPHVLAAFVRGKDVGPGQVKDEDGDAEHEHRVDEELVAHRPVLGLQEPVWGWRMGGG